MKYDFTNWNLVTVILYLVFTCDFRLFWFFIMCFITVITDFVTYVSVSFVLWIPTTLYLHIGALECLYLMTYRTPHKYVFWSLPIFFLQGGFHLKPSLVVYPFHLSHMIIQFFFFAFVYYVILHFHLFPNCFIFSPFISKNLFALLQKSIFVVNEFFYLNWSKFWIILHYFNNHWIIKTSVFSFPWYVYPTAYHCV